MTSAELLIYNCFIMLLCSLDNNGVAGVFLIIWLFPPPHHTHHLSLSLSPFFARYQGLQVIVEKIMTACLPACLFCLSWVCASQTVSVQPESLAEQAAGSPPTSWLCSQGHASRAALIKNSSSARRLPGFVALQRETDFCASSAIFTFYTFFFHWWFFFPHCSFTLFNCNNNCIKKKSLAAMLRFDVHLNPRAQLRYELQLCCSSLCSICLLMREEIDTPQTTWVGLWCHS